MHELQAKWFRLYLSAFAKSALIPQNGFLGHWYLLKNENKYWVIVYLLDTLLKSSL